LDNPLEWDLSNSYKSIFSFANRTNPQSAKVGYVNYDNQYSIYCGLGYEPTFGSGLSK